MLDPEGQVLGLLLVGPQDGKRQACSPCPSLAQFIQTKSPRGVLDPHLLPLTHLQTLSAPPAEDSLSVAPLAPVPGSPYRLLRPAPSLSLTVA